MGTIVDRVIEALTAAGIRSDEAYPGRRIPALTGPVAAVRLGRMDRSIRTTTVQITVMCPAAQGGGVCEDTALRTVETLQGMGATCIKDTCRFDEMADVFYIEIQAQFFGTASEGKWSPGPGYAVTIGIQPMNQTVSFFCHRGIGGEVTALEDAKWEFTLEELLIPGTSEPPEPAEPFTLRVTRSNGDETFSGCRWTSVKREDTIRGVTQIRTGIAQSRSVMGIL